MVRVRVRDLWHSAAHGIWLMDERADGSIYIARPPELVFERVGDSTGAFALPEPTFVFDYHRSKEFFQGLADGLSELGVRANTDRQAGELAVMRDFLKREQQLHDRMTTLHDHTVRQSLLPPNERRK